MLHEEGRCSHHPQYYNEEIKSMTHDTLCKHVLGGMI